ncbi:MAG TPA: cation transporter [Candidatus Saccharimonadales bacterium]|nr:cation transporter [Candidatus Saccharimonadales bacterium]
MNPQQKLHKKALLLEYITIAWNIFEGIVCVTIGLISGSVVLVAYGLESGVEVFASSLVVWDLKGKEKKREKLALKLIGGAYFVVSLYVFIDAALSLLHGEHPDKSIPGIIFIIATVIMMMILGLGKRKVGTQMKSDTVLADAKFTLIDGALAGTVLVGLVLNALFGWWWADQAMALFLSGVAFREGLREFF